MTASPPLHRQILDAVVQYRDDFMRTRGLRPELAVLIGCEVDDALCKFLVSPLLELPGWYLNPYTQSPCVLGCRTIVTNEIGTRSWQIVVVTDRKGWMDQHSHHVSQGYCPAISSDKSWCGRSAGHTGSHGSPRVPTPGLPVDPRNPDWVDWDQ